jgi:hypothetical protein
MFLISIPNSHMPISSDPLVDIDFELLLYFCFYIPQKSMNFSKLYYNTKSRVLTLNGVSIAPTSQVRSARMLLLLMSGETGEHECKDGPLMA